MSDRKTVDISFASALKFWAAFLIILIIAAIIIFILGTIIYVIFIHPLLQELIENLPQLPAIVTIL